LNADTFEFNLQISKSISGDFAVAREFLISAPIQKDIEISENIKPTLSVEEEI